MANPLEAIIIEGATIIMRAIITMDTMGMVDGMGAVAARDTGERKGHESKVFKWAPCGD